jgi:hypothetical protein
VGGAAYTRGMCAACAMAAASGAAGARSWLQTHGYRWLTPRRLKRITVGLCVGAFAVSSIGFSGSTAAQHHHAAPPAVAQR